jgi:two-component system sensor histidine kinase KdpD
LPHPPCAGKPHAPPDNPWTQLKTTFLVGAGAGGPGIGFLLHPALPAAKRKPRDEQKRKGMDTRDRADRAAFARDLLREFGTQARLTVYIGYAPGAGKTYRLLSEAQQLHRSGVRVAVGWVETKPRPDLESLLEGLERIPPRRVERGGSVFEDFDYEAAVAARPQVVILDELAHANLPGATHAKRWQDALALREAGIGVLGALNVAHVETCAAAAESLIGFPVREIVPLSFLKAADQVVAIDVAPEQLEDRLRAGRILHPDDVARALQGPFRPQTLRALRELMLHTVDSLAAASLPAAGVSRALALVTPDVDPLPFLQRAASFADAFNLDLAACAGPRVDAAGLSGALASLGAAAVGPGDFRFDKPKLSALRASFVAIPRGQLASELLNAPVDRDVLVVGRVLPAERKASRDFSYHPYARSARDRMRIGYGRLTVYLGAAAGCGKTYAMLEQAQQLKQRGVDVVIGFVETHGRADTERKTEGLEALPRRFTESGGVRYTELDREAVLRRRPQVVLIDELAHTNASGSKFAKRYEDVLSVLRAGISVMTTLNIQHLEGLSDIVLRLTGIRVRETLPDGVLDLADDFVLIDASPHTLRERLRAGKIYPAERIEAALTSFFRLENLTALRELALREALRVRASARRVSAVSDLVLGVAARERDTTLVQRAARLARRLDADLEVIHVAPPGYGREPAALAVLRETAHAAGATLRIVEDDDPARGLVAAAARAGTTIVVEGPRGKGRLFGPRSFASRLLELGAEEVLVLAPVP